MGYELFKRSGCARASTSRLQRCINVSLELVVRNRDSGFFRLAQDKRLRDEHVRDTLAEELPRLFPVRFRDLRLLRLHDTVDIRIKFAARQLRSTNGNRRLVAVNGSRTRERRHCRSHCKFHGHVHPRKHYMPPRPRSEPWRRKPSYLRTRRCDSMMRSVSSATPTMMSNEVPPKKLEIAHGMLKAPLRT